MLDAQAHRIGVQRYEEFLEYANLFAILIKIRVPLFLRRGNERYKVFLTYAKKV